jgi:hypothetical protein
MVPCSALDVAGSSLADGSVYAECARLPYVGEWSVLPGGKEEVKSRDGRTGFAVLLMDNLEFTGTAPLNPALNPGQPCV